MTQSFYPTQSDIDDCVVTIEEALQRLLTIEKEIMAKFGVSSLDRKALFEMFYENELDKDLSDWHDAYDFYNWFA